MFICFKNGLFQEQEEKNHTTALFQKKNTKQEDKSQVTKDKVLFQKRRPGFVSQGAVQEDQEQGVVQPGFVSPEEEPGFVYLFQEWFVSKKKKEQVFVSFNKKPGRRPETRCCSEEPETTLLVVSC